LKEKIFDEHEKKIFRGRVKWYNPARGFGFIEREDEKKDIFVHVSAVNNSGLKHLKEGEQLTFEIDTSDKRSTAINLRKSH